MLGMLSLVGRAASPTRKRNAEPIERSLSPNVDGTRAHSEAQDDIHKTFDEHVKTRRDINSLIAEYISCADVRKRDITQTKQLEILTHRRLPAARALTDQLTSEIVAARELVERLVSDVQKRNHELGELEKKKKENSKQNEKISSLCLDMRVVQEREMCVRHLEDQLLSIIDGKTEADRKISELVQEHSDLNDTIHSLIADGTKPKNKNDEMSSLQNRLSEQREEQDALNRRIAGLKNQLSDATVESDVLLRRLSDVQAVHDDLLTELESARRSRDDLVRNVQQKGEKLTRTTLQVQRQLRSKQFNDSMRLLKATVIDLGDDLDFIGAVLEKEKSLLSDASGGGVSPAGVEGFNGAWQYIQSFISSISSSFDTTAAASDRCDNRRWVDLPETLLQDQKYQDERNVRPLSCALKQLVICYDLMEPSSRQECAAANGVIMNVAVLCRLARECSYLQQVFDDQKEQDRIAREIEKENRFKRRVVSTAALGGGVGGTTTTVNRQRRQTQQTQHQQQTARPSRSRSRSNSPPQPTARMIF